MRSTLLALGLASAVLAGTVGAAAQPEDRVARARQLFVEGSAAYQAGRFQEAARKFEEGYNLVHSPELAYNVARAYERMSEYDAAIRYFRIYLRTGQLDDNARRDIEGRIAQLEEAKRRQRSQVFTAPPTGDELTNEARTFFQRGVTMFQRRQYEAAMQAFTAALRFAPLPEIYYNMAVTAERLHHHRDAYDYYRDYLRLRPESPDRASIERRMEELRGQQNR